MDDKSLKGDDKSSLTQKTGSTVNKRQVSQGLADDVLRSQQDLAKAAVNQRSAADSEQAVDDQQLPPSSSVQSEPVSGATGQRELEPKFLKPEQPLIIEPGEPEPQAEVKDWVKKTEEGETAELPQPVTDGYGEILVEAAGKQPAEIVLPLDEEEVKQGLHHKAVDSIRWLAEWCVRVMKIATGRVFYKKANDEV